MARFATTVFVTLALTGWCWAGPVKLKIGGGSDVSSIEKNPYQAAVEMSYSASFICNAAIIGEQWVLTAADCVQYLDADDIQVRVGSLLLEQGGQVLAVASLTPSPDFDEYTLASNVAIVKTRGKIDETLSSQPAPIASHPPRGGQKLVVSGWGQHDIFSGGPFYPPELVALIVSRIPLSLCKDVYAENAPGRAVDDTTLCASAAVGKGLCEGDSGSPLTNDMGELVGIVSWGTVGCGDRLGAGYPGVYTNLANAKINRWIADNAK